MIVVVELHIAVAAAKLKMATLVDNIIMTVTAYKVKIVIMVVLFPCEVFVSEIAKPH